MTFDSLLDFFDGGELSLLIPDDDIMCFLARPEIQRGVRRLTHYGLIKTTFWRSSLCNTKCTMPLSGEDPQRAALYMRKDHEDESSLYAGQLQVFLVRSIK
jgi:hypothetical protein